MNVKGILIGMTLFSVITYYIMTKVLLTHDNEASLAPYLVTFLLGAIVAFFFFHKIEETAIDAKYQADMKKVIESSGALNSVPEKDKMDSEKIISLIGIGVVTSLGTTTIGLVVNAVFRMIA